MLSPEFDVYICSMLKYLEVMEDDVSNLCRKDSGNKRFLYYLWKLSITLTLFQNKNTFLLFSGTDTREMATQGMDVPTFLSTDT